MEKIVGTIQDSYYIHPNGLGFNFTNRAEITFVMFLGGAPASTTIKKLLDFWTNYFQKKLKKNINVVIIGDKKTDGKFYAANYSGIENVCNNVWELSKILYDLLYKKFLTKRVVVFGDCGGSIPAILSSTVVPYHSITLTTPYYEVIGSEHEFDTSQYSMWYSRELSIDCYNNQANHKSYFKTIEYFDEYTKNSNNVLNLHWANTIIGTDLLFRHKANLLPKRQNIRIIDHAVPKSVEGHMLIKHLVNTGQYYKMVAEEIKIQQLIIDNTV